MKTSELAPVFGLATGVTPFLMLAGGFVNDRFGPKLTIAFGGAAIAAGYALTAFAESVGMLYVGYGLCVGVGTGLVNGCTINSSVKWFPDRRGFAGGLVTACLGVGAAVLPFAARWMIDVCGIVETLLAFGACSGVVIVLSAFGTRKCPDELQAAFRPAGCAAQAVEAPSMNWLEMVRTPLFYPLFILFTSSAMMGLMLLSNISAIAQEQVGAGAGLAALGVSVISIANTSGRFLSGTLSDRIGRIPTLVLVLVVALAGLGMLVSAGHGDTGHFLVHLGSPWNAALTFKKKSGRLPPRKKVALTPNFRQIQVTREEPRKKDERYDQYCRATFQISRSMARLPDHFFQDSSLARRWQEDSHS